MQLDAFQKKLLIQGGSTLAIILALLGGIIYFGSEIGNNSDEIAALRRELAQRSHALNSLAALRSEYRTKAQADLAAMSLYVPTEEQLINLRQEFQVLAAKSDLAISYTFLSDTAPTAASFGAYNFRLDLTGDFDKLVSFIDTLQRFRYLSDFRGFSITRGGAKSTMGLSGIVYYHEEPAQGAN